MEPKISRKSAAGEAAPVDVSAPFTVGDAEIDPASGSVRLGGHIAHIEPRLVAVLAGLARRAGETVTRQELLNAGWGER